LDLVVASVRGDATTKSAQGQERHELRENKLALVHGGPLREDAKDHKSWNRLSNRDQTEMPKNQNESLTYDALMCKRWDTTDSPTKFINEQSISQK
jgi:hypothetical protein